MVIAVKHVISIAKDTAPMKKNNVNINEYTYKRQYRSNHKSANMRCINYLTIFDNLCTKFNILLQNIVTLILYCSIISLKSFLISLKNLTDHETKKTQNVHFKQNLEDILLRTCQPVSL